MKKLLFAAIVIVATVMSCRKKELRDVVTGDDLGPAHCLNGVIDEDELGVDCGGVDCDDCVDNDAPCSNSANEFYLHNGFSYETRTFTSMSIDTTGNWTFIANTDGNSSEYLRLIFPGKPSITTTYTGISGTSFIESDEVDVRYYDPSALDRVGTGDVYVSYSNGSYTITSCDYSFHEWGQGTPSGTQYFSVTF